MRARRSPLALTILACLMVACAGQHVLPVDPISIAKGDSLFADWILLPQPEEQLLLGSGWDTQGAFEPTCYVTEAPTVSGGSMGHVTVSWGAGKKSDISVKVAKLFGLGGAVDQADSGSIEIDSVFTARAASIRPAVGCADAAFDQLPLKPAIVGMIGARSYSFRLTSARNANAQADAEASIKSTAVAGNIEFKNGASGARVAKFDKPRWVAVQLEGWELSPRADTIWTGRQNFGQTSPLGGLGWDVRVDTTANSDVYAIHMTRTLGPVVVDTILARHGDGFPFGRKASTAIAAMFFTGHLQVLPGRQYNVLAERRSFVGTTFSGSGARQLVLDWIRKRQAGN